MATLKLSEGYYDITDGPSREELFDALRLFNERRRVIFELLPRQGVGGARSTGRKVRFEVQVLEIMAEDDSGHSWCVKVRFFDNQRDGIFLAEAHPVNLYYHDKNRHGAVIDARPVSEQIKVDRNGNIWAGNRYIGNLPRRTFS